MDRRPAAARSASSPAAACRWGVPGERGQRARTGQAHATELRRLDRAARAHDARSPAKTPRSPAKTPTAVSRRELAERAPRTVGFPPKRDSSGTHGTANDCRGPRLYGVYL